MCVHRAHAMRQNKKSKFINNFTTTRRIVSYGVLTVENDTHNCESCVASIVSHSVHIRKYLNPIFTIPLTTNDQMTWWMRSVAENMVSYLWGLSNVTDSI
jgi:uncharacterized protein (DUF1919 family)